MKNLMAMSLLLICASCTSSPQKVELEILPNKTYMAQTSLIEAMRLEPFYKDTYLPIDVLNKMGRGYTYDTLDEFGDNIKEDFEIRHDIVDDWVERIRKRYERMRQ